MIIQNDTLTDVQTDDDFPMVDNSATSVDASIDPLAGGTLNGKPILSVEQVAAHLNRTGAAFTDKPTDAKQSDADNSVINFGFHASQDELAQQRLCLPVGPTAVLRRMPNISTSRRSPKRRGPPPAKRCRLGTTSSRSRSSRPTRTIADINFGNLASAPTTQAYATLPFDRIL